MCFSLLPFVCFSCLHMTLGTLSAGLGHFCSQLGIPWRDAGTWQIPWGSTWAARLSGKMRMLWVCSFHPRWKHLLEKLQLQAGGWQTSCCFACPYKWGDIASVSVSGSKPRWVPSHVDYFSPHSPQGQSPTIPACLLTRALARLLCFSDACLMYGDANLLFEYFQVLHGLSMIVTYLAEGGIFEVWPQNSMLIWNCTSVIFKEAYMSLLLQNPPCLKHLSFPHLWRLFGQLGS